MPLDVGRIQVPRHLLPNGTIRFWEALCALPLRLDWVDAPALINEWINAAGVLHSGV